MGNHIFISNLIKQIECAWISSSRGPRCSPIWQLDWNIYIRCSSNCYFNSYSHVPLLAVAILSVQINRHPGVYMWLYMYCFMWHVITYSGVNFIGGLIKWPLMLEHRWVITSHIKLKFIITHPYSNLSKYRCERGVSESGLPYIDWANKGVNVLRYVSQILHMNRKCFFFCADEIKLSTGK